MRKERTDFTLYVDEFQNIATDTFDIILSEARKLRLNLVLAHQYLGQVSDRMRQSVIGNAGTLIVFRVGAEDAPLLARELGTDPRLADRHAELPGMGKALGRPARSDCPASARQGLARRDPAPDP